AARQGAHQDLAGPGVGLGHLVDDERALPHDRCLHGSPCPVASLVRPRLTVSPPPEPVSSGADRCSTIPGRDRTLAMTDTGGPTMFGNRKKAIGGAEKLANVPFFDGFSPEELHRVAELAD